MLRFSVSIAFHSAQQHTCIHGLTSGCHSPSCARPSAPSLSVTLTITLCLHYDTHSSIIPVVTMTHTSTKIGVGISTTSENETDLTVRASLAGARLGMGAEESNRTLACCTGPHLEGGHSTKSTRAFTSPSGTCIPRGTCTICVCLCRKVPSDISRHVFLGANACVADKLHGMFHVSVGCHCMCDVIKPATVVRVGGVPLYFGEREGKEVVV